MAQLSVRVTPRSSKPGLGEWKSDPAGRPFLEVRVASAPADSAANRELIRLLAKALGIAPSGIELVSGESSRLKRLSLDFDERRMIAMLGG